MRSDRVYIACHAMSALIGLGKLSEQEVSRRAYMFADALLREDDIRRTGMVMNGLEGDNK